MDIINPEVMIIGKRYYRNNMIEQKSDFTQNEQLSYIENPDENPCDYEDVESNFHIYQKDIFFYSDMNIAPMFYGYIIGKKGESKKRIELDTKTTITFPKVGSTGLVNVKGHNYSSVDRALVRLTDHVDDARLKSPFTHFFSVACNNECVVKKFENFKAQILHSCIGDRGVEEGLFQDPFKLHLTLTMLVLGDHRELDNVVGVFKDFRRENDILFKQPWKIHIRGLQYMNDDPCEVRVLYGKVAKDLDEEKLQSLANKLVDYLFERRVIPRKEHNSVTLHMTVLNASFISERDMALDSSSDVNNPRNFDCSNIIQRFSDWDFGVIDVDQICISKRHGIATDRFYASAASFKFG